MTNPSRVAILHYHLQRGGVSTVIENACRALASRGIRACVLVGEEPPAGCGLNACTLPALAYGSRLKDVDDLYLQLRTAARKLLDGDPDIWHIHNHSLGKNDVFPQLPAKLAEEGERVVLQPHDFAEDYRPANYAHLCARLEPEDFSRIYPHSPCVNYALLNSRDLEFMSKAGIDRQRLHLLPNAVDPFASGIAEMATDSSGSSLPLILYPTRAIRRKNIGELLFWASALKGRARFGITLAPQNPRERPLYDRWVEFARKLDLPIDFELGKRRDLPDLIAASRAVITTSLAEGFGMAFLEPWTAGRPVIGRRLAEITEDFSDMGIDLGACYDSLDIPIEWLGRDRVLDQIRLARGQMLRLYGISPSVHDRAETEDAVLDKAAVDFGRLGEELQRDAIEFASSQSSGGKLGDILDRLPDHNTIEANSEAIVRNLSVDRYAERLLNIYCKVMSATTASTEYIRPRGLLDLFLKPERFSILLAEQSFDDRGAR